MREVPTDRKQDTAADTTSRWGGSESLSDGKHGSLQGGSSGLPLLRVLCPGLIGTAGYGPVRPGGVGPVAGSLSQSRGPDSSLFSW